MRYYFHLRDRDEYIIDEEGLELASIDAVKEAATAGARSVIASEAMAGTLLLSASIEVDDEHGERVLVLPFRDAVLLDG